MNSLVAYDGESGSESDDGQEGKHPALVHTGLTTEMSTKLKHDDRSLNSDESLDPGPSTSQIKIKRPHLSTKIKQSIISHAGAHVSDDVSESSAQDVPVASSSSSVARDEPGHDGDSQMDVEEDDELSILRRLLLPPDIPGVNDWGIPPDSDKPCDPAIATKLLHFHDLKSGPTPKHFNDSLMSNQSFRNPHMYAKLVEFVEIDDESTGCYQRHAISSTWDGLFGHGPEDWDWDAERIAQFQKTREQQQSSSQSQRKQIDFTSAKHKDNRGGVQRQHNEGRGKEPRVLGGLAGSRYNPYLASTHKWKGKWG